MNETVVKPDIDQWLAHSAKQIDETIPLKDGDGNGTSDGMTDPDIHGRLSSLEGGTATFKWAVGIVSSIMIGAMAIIVAMQIFTMSQVSSVSQKVDDLPDRINQNLMEMNRTLLQAVQVGRETQPVIVVPQYQPAPMVAPEAE